MGSSDEESWRDRSERAIRGISFFVVRPVIGAALVVGMRLISRYRFQRVLGCRFYGPPTFLTSCRRAIDLLRDLDAGIHDTLTRSKIVCWCDPSKFWFAKGLCPISPGWLEWGEHGVITCLVYYYFHTLTFYGHSLIFPLPRRKSAMAREVVYANVRSWLEKHGFPKELVTAFAFKGKEGGSPLLHKENE